MSLTVSPLTKTCSNTSSAEDIARFIVIITDIIFLASCCYFIAGIQFKVTDPKFKEFRTAIDETVDAMKRLAILDFLPWIANVLPDSLVTWICRKDAIQKVCDKLTAYFQVGKKSSMEMKVA